MRVLEWVWAMGWEIQTEGACNTKYAFLVFAFPSVWALEGLKVLFYRKTTILSCSLHVLLLLVFPLLSL